MHQSSGVIVDNGGLERPRTVQIITGHVLLPFILTSLLLLNPTTPPAAANSVPCDCETCHGDNHGPGWQACSACHESPPSTGSHLVHFDSAPVMALQYGDTAVSSTDDAYKFGCGNCHPLDWSKHRDGTVQVELYDAFAPPGSIKEKNPASAAYDQIGQTCSDVYCHSGYTITSSVVSAPLTYPANPIPPGYTLNNSYIMDETCSNLIRAPYTVTNERVYMTTPPWGTSGTFTACDECHAFPLTTYWPTVDAMVGDSHQWVDDWGYNWGHAYNMGFDPMPCRTCHYSTVTEKGTSTAYPTTPISTYGPVPISSRAMHVNGAADVAFDTVNAFLYRNSYSLAGANYDASTRTCSNVPCHYNPTGPGPARWQQEETWGWPWRYVDDYKWLGCDTCHRYGYLDPACEPAP